MDKKKYMAQCDITYGDVTTQKNFKIIRNFSLGGDTEYNL